MSNNIDHQSMGGTLVTMKSSRTGLPVPPDHWTSGGGYSRETVERFGLVPIYENIKPDIVEHKKVVFIR